jgi:hypothetical protein
MVNALPEYDPRYLVGIQLFNEHEFFEAHEVWEDLWADNPGDNRRFYQALIQAAVALYHFGNRNLAGARKLYRSSHAYMKPYGSPYKGLDAEAFWRAMGHCFAGVLDEPPAQPPPTLDAERIPMLTLDPAPAAWPNPADYLEARDEA